MSFPLQKQTRGIGVHFTQQACTSQSKIWPWMLLSVIQEEALPKAASPFSENKMCLVYTLQHPKFHTYGFTVSSRDLFFS